jgi:putative endonuclease
MMEKLFYVYIMASARNGTLYIGVTSNLIKRVYEHKSGVIAGFTKEHHCKILVYYQVFDNAEAAITREKQMKKWNRIWKLREIEDMNPHWNDLYETLV